MRLLNTSEFSFKEFWSPETTPPYAILSHRWGEDEVTFKEWRKGTRTSGPGYDKIRRFCRTARAYGYKWAWADTCCIDKRSSAELTEAINSMYAWYGQSSLCITYLQDVRCASNTARDVVLSQIRKSAWFRRGWTLQELLAPATIVFFSSEWVVIGTVVADDRVHRGVFRDYYPLAPTVSSVTGIPHGVLTIPRLLSRASVAERMSWASRRETSRAEDMAYCLLGLFGVNLPLLYGEGASKAFMRLQLEIIKKSPDESIFAWRDPAISTWFGLLAGSPEAFRHSSGMFITDDCENVRDDDSVVATAAARVNHLRLPYNMTNRGLEFRAYARGSEHDPYSFLILLDCQERTVDGRILPCVLRLRGVRPRDNSDRVRDVCRANPDDLNAKCQWEEIVRYESWKVLGELCFEIPQAGL